MKNILCVIGLGFLIAISGCSKWNQDPLADKDGVLATGQPKPIELEQPKATSSDAIRILAPDFALFKEGEETEVVISVRNLLPGYSTQLGIANIVEFPNAIFNPSTGQFKWTPRAGLILPSEIEKKMTIKVTAIGSKPGSADIFNEKEVSISLSRKFLIPRISSIQKTLPTLREDENLDVKVMIEDADADPVDQKTWSNIQILPTQWQKKSLSGYMSLKSYRYISQSNYEAVFTIDLKDAEVTESLDTYYFDINLISRFHQISDRQTQSLVVYTKFSDLKTTWTTLVEGKMGSVINYQFLVYDPKGELRVSFEGIKNEITGSVTKCINATTSVLSCTFTFDTKMLTAPKVFNFSLMTKSKNQNSTDAQMVSKDLLLTVNVTN